MSYTDTAAARLTTAYGGASELGWTDFLGPLLELALSFLQDCLAGGNTPAGVVKEAKKPSLRTRLGLRLRARRAGLDPGRTTDALLAACAESTADEVQGFVSENSYGGR